MSRYSFVESYKICDKCGEGVSRTGDDLCKNCKPKKICNRTLGKSLSRKYLRKFETKNILSNRRDILENSISGNLLANSTKYF
jgi:hypothetical protein